MSVNDSVFWAKNYSISPSLKWLFGKKSFRVEEVVGNTHVWVEYEIPHKKKGNEKNATHGRVLLPIRALEMVMN